MLTAHVERYLELRRTLGYQLRNPSTNLHAFARFADAGGDTHLRSSTAVAWATQSIFAVYTVHSPAGCRTAGPLLARGGPGPRDTGQYVSRAPATALALYLPTGGNGSDSSERPADFARYTHCES